MNDRDILRSLAAELAIIAADPIQEDRRELWRACNSLRSLRPPIYFRGGRLWGELLNETELQCRDPWHRQLEYDLRLALLRTGLGDDTIVEPWWELRPVFVSEGWGVSIETQRPEGKGAWKHRPPLSSASDWTSLQSPRHVIAEAASAERVERCRALFGDLLMVHLDRSPAATGFAGDLSTDLGYLRGIENLMSDMYEEPEALHALLAFMRDGVLSCHEAAEAAGDWSLLSHRNQAFCYADELEGPAPDAGPRSRRQLWLHISGQEFTLVSPVQHEEFLLRYQLPILSAFGLVAYGCCEDLSRKIGMLRQIPNLRRIAVAPSADLRRCAEQVGTEYVMSWRPNPATHVCCGFDEPRIRREIAEGLAIVRGQHLDITMKDVDTVQGDIGRCQRWIAIVREEVQAVHGCAA
jgi:hypothetical protein